MHRSHNLASSRSTGLALLFILALLVTQWIGLMHRVAHAGLFSDVSTLTLKNITEKVVKENKVQNKNENLSHSCVAFDAATLGYAVVTSPIAMLVMAAQYETTQRIAFLSWSAPFFPCFSSRAPPRN